MGAGCCKADVELNPDKTPKDPQTKDQKKEDARELRRAAFAADWALMRTLLRRMPLRQICSGADKKEAGEEDVGNTPLHYSVSINHLRGVKKLLRYGILPNLTNKAGKTSLHLALEGGKLKAARILMDASVASSKGSGGGGGASSSLINAKDASGVTPLLAVVAAGRLKLAREVLGLCKELDMGVNYDVINAEGNSMVLYAAKWGWFEELEAWVDRVKEPRKLLNVQNKEGETVLGHVLLFRASGLLNKQRALALVTKLMDLGALAKLPSFKEKVPLINLAAAADDKDIYTQLLAKGAEPLKARDVLGRSPLHYAAAKGARVLAADLLDAGIKPYALDGQGNTPLHLAAMRGQEALVALLLERADDKIKALLTPNKSGLTAYHLALRAGANEKAQRNSLALMEQLGEQFTRPVLGPGKKVLDTPLMLAIQGHQDRVVKAMLQKGLSPNERNVAGELPLARVLRCATAVTYDNDSGIFDQLMSAGADMSAASDTAHPLLALCKNNLSRFAEKVVGVLTERSGGGGLDWDKRDEQGYTPLALAAFHDNAWLIRHLVDEVKVDPNTQSQRSLSTAPEVVGTTGGLCSAKPITRPGTVPGQTPLMCAAKGASVAATQLLLNRGADVHAVDSEGRTALQHAMQLDKAASLQVAAALLRMGARPEQGIKSGEGQWRQCTDLLGEYWPHRAVRYGMSSFLALWSECGGQLDTLLTSTADDADDMPGAELQVEEKTDFLDILPSRVNNAVEAEDEELVDEYNGEDSEQAPAGEDNEGDGATTTAAARPVAEGVELDSAAADAAAVVPGAPRRRTTAAASESSDNDDCGTEEVEGDGLEELLSSGQAESFYSGPTPTQITRWRRSGLQWWDEFWVDRESLPDSELEDDPHWEDKYNTCEEGEEWIDEEDVEEEIWERVRAEQRSIANAVRRARAAALAEQQQQLHAEQQQHRHHRHENHNGQDGLTQKDGLEGQGEEPVVSEALLVRVSSGLAHKLFRHRLPNAVVPETTTPGVDEGTLAAGSPTKWLRRRSFTAAATPTTASSPSTPPPPSSAAAAAAADTPRTPSPSTTPTPTTTPPSLAPLTQRRPPLAAAATSGSASVCLSSPPPLPPRNPLSSSYSAGQLLGDRVLRTTTAAGPVAESREEDLAVVDLEGPMTSCGSRPRRQSPPQGGGSQGGDSNQGSGRSLRFQPSAPEDDRTVLLLSPADGGGGAVKPSSPPQRSDDLDPDLDSDPRSFPGPVPQRIASVKRSQSSTRGSPSAASSKTGMGVTADAEAAGGDVYGGGSGYGSKSQKSGSGSRVFSQLANDPGMALSKSFSSAKGMLTSGVSGERLYGNEPYYQPSTLYDGQPRYMKVPTEPFPAAKYDKYVSDLEARVASYKLKDEKRLEGGDLRARNIAWYHKSMSPAEYPLKPGKWKSFQRMSAKATEQARQRRPRRPGQKPQIRKKKVWFGLPNMPSRPELSLTSPLVYAVRLGRVKCVEVLLRVGGGGDLVDIPDSHGVTPLSYAMYMLAKDRHNRTLQQMVDLLLAARPRVGTCELWSRYLRPRMDEQLKTLQAAEAAAKGGEGAMAKADKQALKELQTMVAFLDAQQGGGPPPNYSKLLPTILDPLVLGALLGDVGRLTYLVQQLGADLNAAWVWLTDIPTYFQGLMEKQLSRCNSRCGPLHVAICLKQYDAVRALLDLGSDPNLAGEEYSGDSLRDVAKRDKLARERQKEVQERKQAGANFNPYTKLWGDRPSGLKALLMGIKRLIASIEIPGFARPHPWLSPLHLACRLGLPDVTYLLLRRGAAVNGGAASAFAPKSPMEEALMYARSNAQAYSTTSDRSTYNYILEEACLVNSDRMDGLIAEAARQQGARHAEMMEQLSAHARGMVAKGVKGKNGKPATLDDLMKSLRDFQVCKNASYDPVSLRYIVVPDANAMVLESKAKKMYADMMAMMDPIKGAIKAVTLAAKIIVRILLEMMKRPIAHHDPSLACAHVLLNFRAPLNVSEKQTGILMRDILDNGNGLGNDADPRLSYYRWLGIDPASVQETVWVQSVVNKISVLKANVDYGYMVMDMAPDYKVYDKSKKKFMSQVEASILNIGTSSITPHYMKKVLQEITATAGAATAGAGAAGAGWPPGSLEAVLDAMFEQYCQITASKGKQPGAAPTDAEMDQAARDLLPPWLLAAPPPPSAAGAPAGSVVVITPQSSRQDVKTFLIRRFVQYSSVGAQPIQYLPPPVDGYLAGKVLQSNDLSHEKPVISQDALAAVQPTQDDLPDADVCTTVVRAYNALLVQRVQSQSEALRWRANARQATAEGKRATARSAAGVVAAVAVQLSQAGMASGRLAFEEGPIFEAAVDDPTWDAAITQLGGGAGVRAMMTRLRAAAAAGEVARIADPLALVRGLEAAAAAANNNNGTQQDIATMPPDALLDGLESQLGRPLPKRLRLELAKSLSDAADGGGGGSEQQRSLADDPEAAIERHSEKALKLAEEVEEAGGEAAVLALVESRMGPRVASMFKVLGQVVAEGGELPPLDPEELMNDMLEEIKKKGSEAVMDVWERKLGKVLPDGVRQEVEQGAKDFADQLMQTFEEGGLGAVVSAFGGIAADAVTSVADSLVQGAAEAGLQKLEGGMDRLEGGIDRATSVATDLMDGNVSSLLDEAGGFALPLPTRLMSGPVGQAVAGAVGDVVTGGGAAADSLDAAAAAGQSVVAAAQQLSLEGLAAMDEGQRALEAALSSGGDFSALAALGKGRMSVLLSDGGAAALQALLADFRSLLPLQGGDAVDASAATLERLAGQLEGGIQSAMAGAKRLADAVLAAGSGEGWDAMAEALGVDPGQLLEGPEALREGAGAALEALRNGAEDVWAAAEAGAEAGMESAGRLLEGAMGDAMVSKRLEALKNPRTRALLGSFVEGQLLSVEARERAVMMQEELAMSSEQFLDGAELDLGVDVATLMDEQEAFREVLLTMLETLNIDEMI